MIGLGVGIDYALFILTRFREAYRTPGPDVRGRARVGRAGDGHRRARGAVRGHDRRDRAAGDDAAGRRLPLRGGDLRVDRRAAGDARLADTAAGAADDRGRARRQAQSPRPRSRSPRGQAGAVATPAGPDSGRRGRQARRSDRGTGTASPRESAIAGRTWLRWSAFVQRRPWTIAVAATLAMLLIAAPATGAAARLERRLQRPREPDHTPRVRAAGAGLRRRLQRPAAGRREGPEPEQGSRQTGRDRGVAPGWRQCRRRKAARGDRHHAGRRLGRARQDQPLRRSGHDHRLSALLAAGVRDHSAGQSACATA